MCLFFGVIKALVLIFPFCSSIDLAKMQAKSFVGAKLPSATLGTSRHPSGRGRVPLVVRNDSCLIVNTKGGGHAFLGLHLARKLVSDGHQVTILNDGDQVGLTIDECDQ